MSGGGWLPSASKARCTSVMVALRLGKRGFAQGRKQCRVPGASAGRTLERLTFSSKEPVDSRLAAVRTPTFPTRVPVRQAFCASEDQRSVAPVLPAMRIGFSRDRRAAHDARVLWIPFCGIHQAAAVRTRETPYGHRLVAHQLLLLRKLGDSAGDPRYIFTEPRVGYRMLSGSAEGNR